MKIIVASNNKNKLREFREILSPMDFDVLAQSDVGVNIEVEETGTTFAENAYLKAKAIYDIIKLPVVADDSGLEIEALNGTPGVYSARYAPVGQRNAKILSAMRDIPYNERNANYTCCVCYIDNHGKEHYFEGKCFGKIGYECRGTNGFSYDSIFMYGDKSFAEISPDEKNKISHRAKAINLFKDYICK